MLSLLIPSGTVTVIILFVHAAAPVAFGLYPFEYVIPLGTGGGVTSIFADIVKYVLFPALS